MEIIPAIMPVSWRDMENKIADVKEVVRFVQLDLMDGKYTPAITWPFDAMHTENWKKLINEDIGMPYWEDVELELDLMVDDVPAFWEYIIKMGPKRIVLHFPKKDITKANLKNWLINLDPYFHYEIEWGIAYENGTYFQDILDIKDYIKFVQCMGIQNVGIQGSPLDNTVYDRIQKVKDELPDMIISVDGAVNENTLEDLRVAGVVRFVMGSAIYTKEIPSLAIQEFKEMVNG